MFWDSSALVPWLVPEARTQAIGALLAADEEVTVWWGTLVECQSAIYRRHREAPLDEAVLSDVLARLAAFSDDADTIIASDALRRRAGRLLASHPIRAADALQMAAGLAWCEEQPASQGFVCLDDRLRGAARREGFRVLPADA